MIQPLNFRTFKSETLNANSAKENIESIPIGDDEQKSVKNQLNSTIDDILKFYNNRQIQTNAFLGILWFFIFLPIASFQVITWLTPDALFQEFFAHFLIEFAESETLKKAIVKLMENKKLREKLGKKGKKIVKRYSKDIVIKKLISFYDQLVFESDVHQSIC